MKASNLGLLSALLAQAAAHELFLQFIVNGTITNPWQYVRDVDAINGWGVGEGDRAIEYYKMSPNMDPLDESTIRCGRNATKFGVTTDVATVEAGDEVGFAIKTYDDLGLTHGGPVLAYLSKTDGDLKTYAGDGDWFKIAEVGSANATDWKTTYMKEWRFNLPKTTPPGKYLLRVEQIWPTPSPSYVQFFTNCAQLDIAGTGGGIPGPLVKFPGAYQLGGPGLVHTTESYSDYRKYTMPGPPVWTG
jgi:hypothetical protein